MKTPILDFITEYEQRETLRLHMPGHKGAYAGDITEIKGADSLYEADGIIARSEANASLLFGCPTLYSTEGSSQCIRAMLYLALMDARQQGKTPRILAGRNAHKSFVSGAALLELEIEWLMGQGGYLCCDITPELLEKAIVKYTPTAVYLTAPDYLGNLPDVAALAAVCHRYGTLLLVDNAHGAYLRFLSPSRHPMDLGADLCCDSAHKTLPVLTGGAYLHLREKFLPFAKTALAIFGSTSPSYLILQSLDRANAYLADGYAERLIAFAVGFSSLRQRLERQGYVTVGQEALKLTLSTKPYGYTGQAFAEILRQKGIEVEFADPDFVVLMLSPDFTAEQLGRLEEALLSIPAQAPVLQAPPVWTAGRRVLSLRQAMLSVGESVPLEACLGRILASATVACPPAVPILVGGEQIDAAALEAFRYYGVETLWVIKQ